MGGNHGGRLESPEGGRAKASKPDLEGAQSPQVCLWFTLTPPRCLPSSIPGTNSNQRDEPLLAAASAGPVQSQFRLKKILVPVDFSDCSKKALQYAIPFAKEHQAALTLLYLVA